MYRRYKMNSIFRLGFDTDQHRTSILDIRHPDISATSEDIVAAMDGIIDAGVIQSRYGRFIGRSSAKLIQTEYEDFDVQEEL
jgi:hypothetical protein